MKSQEELTKRQLQVLPFLLSCPTIEEAVNKLKYNTTRAADTAVSLLSHSNQRFNVVRPMICSLMLPSMQSTPNILTNF